MPVAVAVVEILVLVGLEVLVEAAPVQHLVQMVALEPPILEVEVEVVRAVVLLVDRAAQVS
jgi:hypothetical protein